MGPGATKVWQGPEQTSRRLLIISCECNLLVTPRGGVSMLKVYIRLLKILGSILIGKEIDCSLIHC